VRAAFAGLLLLMLPAAAIACGHCAEDKIAAAYDHSVIVRATDRRHEVAFLAIEGEIVASPQLSREIQGAVDSLRGVDRGTARVSLPAGSLSFAYDPARQNLGTIMRALEKTLAPKGLSTSLLRVIN